MKNDKLAILFEQYLSGRMSKAERAELRTLLQDPAYQEYFESLVNNSVTGYKADSISDPGKEKHIEKLFERIHVPQMPAVHRVHFLRRNWMRYAAAVILIIGTGAYLWLKPTKNIDDIAAIDPVGFENVEPGKDRATLTLADGSVIMLDSAGSGAIASQGNTDVIKLTDGSIIYNAGNSQKTQVVMNTMSTPRGGKYQLTLPDGTKVWLNAASSITFPVVFTGNNRSVKITGEVYFEVVSDKTKPFSVITENTEILALGTDFNVNAYDDEKDMKVTLLEGSVRVADKQHKKSVLLTPGQQAQINNNNPPVIQKANIDKVMAWKNGLFNFEDATLDEVMRQITRWYDIKVIYEQGIPDIQLWGKMSRTTNLSGLLKNLKDVGVKYRVNEEKRELVILR